MLERVHEADTVDGLAQRLVIELIEAVDHKANTIAEQLLALEVHDRAGHAERGGFAPADQQGEALFEPDVL